MLDRVSFQNFKSLKSVTIDLSPLTVLVGPNGSGKSSVLTGIDLLARTGIKRLSEKIGRARGHRLGAIFTGPHDPRRIASPGRPTVLKLAMREAGNDELVLTISVPETSDGPSHELTFQVFVEGPAGPLDASFVRSDSDEEKILEVLRRIDKDKLLDDLRVRRFASVVHLHLDASVMCRTSMTEEEVPLMAADGEGLASTLAWLAGAKPDTLASIATALAEVVPGVRRILTHRERVVDRVMEKVDIDGQPIWRPVDRPRIGDRFSIVFDDGNEVPADLLSEGTVLALGLLTKLHEPGRPRVVLLDDVDRGLHIEAQAKLVGVLRALMKRDPELQIVCTTHSTYLLNLFKPAEVRVLALDAERATHAKALPDHPDFEKWKFGTQTGELWAALGDAWVTAPTPAKPEEP